MTVQSPISNCVLGVRSSNKKKLKGLRLHFSKRQIKPSFDSFSEDPPSLLAKPDAPLNHGSRAPGPPAVSLSRLPHASMRVLYNEPLKEGSNTNSSDNKGENDERPSSSIRFQDTVSVVEVPSRDEYDLETRSLMWSTKEEMDTNKERCLEEFYFETYWSPKAKTRSWWMCREEKDMVVYKGELVHQYTFMKITGNDVPCVSFTKLRSKLFIAKQKRLQQKQQRISLAV